jgi:hypothetical protein
MTLGNKFSRRSPKGEPPLRVHTELASTPDELLRLSAGGSHYDPPVLYARSGGLGAWVRQPLRRDVPATIVESTRCETADLLQVMAITAARVLRWMTRAASLALSLPCERANTYGIVISRAGRHAPVSLCSYSDAEHQILLCELHYPPVGRRRR